METGIQSSLYAFPSDIVDDGLDRIAAWCDRIGADTLSLALAYHQARDVVPHGGEKPRLRYRRDGVFFHPNEEIWTGGRLRPQTQPADETTAVSRALEYSSGPRIESWTVFLHNTGLGETHPDVTTETCFGDRILSNLCPSHPDVIDYSRRLARDISSRGINLVAEALSAQTFAHGHHHERSFAPISAGAEALLALCFCTHCVAPMNEAGGDSERLAARTRQQVQDAYAGATELPVTREALAEAVGDDLFTLLSSRENAVTLLASEVALAVHDNNQRLSFMDLTGAVLGYSDGFPVGAPAAEHAWRLSLNPAALAASADSYSILGYARDAERLATDVASYRDILGNCRLRVILRPGHPDTDSAEHLAEKVEACTTAGADQVDFYNYGMYDESVLSRISDCR